MMKGETGWTRGEPSRPDGGEVGHVVLLEEGAADGGELRRGGFELGPGRHQSGWLRHVNGARCPKEDVFVPRNQGDASTLRQGDVYRIHAAQAQASRYTSADFGNLA